MDKGVALSINSFPLGGAQPVDTVFLTSILEQLQILNDRFSELQAAREQDQETIRYLQKVIELYIDPDPGLFDPNCEYSDRLAEAIRKKTASTKDYGIDLMSLQDRVAELEGQKGVQPAQKDRREILRALLAANDGKMLAEEARKVMRVPKSRFSELLSTMGDYVETKPFSGDKRKKVLILKNKKG